MTLFGFAFLWCAASCLMWSEWAVSGYTEVLAKTNACFSPVGGVESDSFAAPRDGKIVGFKLDYVSGGVACNSQPLSNWGCLATSRGDIMMVALFEGSVESTFSLMYPLDADVEDVTLFGPNVCNGDCVHYYKLDSYGPEDDEIIIQSDTVSYSVSTAGEYFLGICIGLCSASQTDNRGTTCADVYFLYEEEEPSCLAVDDSVAGFSLTPDAAEGGDSEGNSVFSLMDLDGNAVVDGCYQCSNPDHNQLCAKLEIESLQCGVYEQEVIEVTVTAKHIKGDTDLFTIISKDEDYIALLNDYSGQHPNTRVESDWSARSNGRDIRVGGVFITPSCGADYLQELSKDGIEDIWRPVKPGRQHFFNRLVLSGRDYSDWELLSEDLVGRATEDNPIRVIIANNPLDGLSVQFESQTVGCGDTLCSYDGVSFDIFSDSNYKFLFAADAGVIQICQVDVRRECQSISVDA